MLNSGWMDQVAVINNMYILCIYYYLYEGIWYSFIKKQINTVIYNVDRTKWYSGQNESEKK